MSEKFNRKSAKGYDICVVFVFLFILLVTADQFIKQVVVNNISLHGSVVVIDKFFSIYYAQNTGSAFSLFANQAWGIYFLTGISIVLGLGIFILMLISSRHSMKLLSLAFCLLTSGAFGNLIDRIRLRYVVDYLRFDFGTYTFPIFNFADMCAVVGTILLICIIVFGSKYFESFWNILFKKKETRDADSK